MRPHCLTLYGHSPRPRAPSSNIIYQFECLASVVRIGIALAQGKRLRGGKSATQKVMAIPTKDVAQGHDYVSKSNPQQNLTRWSSMSIKLRIATFNLENLDDKPGQEPRLDERIA